MLSTQDLLFGYPKNGALGQALNLSLLPRQMTCLLGSNGSGKSTLIRTLAGLQKPLGGRIFWEDQAFEKLSPKQRAKLLALVLSPLGLSANLKVEEVIDMGNYPHLNRFQNHSIAQKEKVDQALEKTTLQDLRNKQVYQLSDGERQKMMIARALVQDAPLIILDEPTAHLDILNRVQIFHLLYDLAQKEGKAILISTHELKLALEICQRCLIIAAQGEIFQGGPEDLILNGSIAQAFPSQGLYFDNIRADFTVAFPSNGLQVELKGKGASLYWTQKALEKHGFQVSSQPQSIKVSVLSHDPLNNQWSLELNNTTSYYHSIQTLTEALKYAN